VEWIVKILKYEFSPLGKCLQDNGASAGVKRESAITADYKKEY
jgi:hypothetical protein